MIRKPFLIGIAVLFLATGTAHATEEHLLRDPPYKEQKLPEWYICYRVEQTPLADWYQGRKNWRYLAMYQDPKTKSKIVWKLRIDETIYTDKSLWNEDDYYFQKNWVRITWTDNANRETFPDKEGWVLRKHLKEISCDSMEAPVRTH